MSAETLRRMAEAAAFYIELPHLQQALHGRIAAMTRNEAAYICNGAASGLYLALAACLELITKLPYEEVAAEQIGQLEVILFAAHRNPYDRVVRQLGLKLVQIGYPNVIEPPGVDDLVRALSVQTAAVLYVAVENQGWQPKGALSLREVAEVAREKNVPVIVDAAAQLPPPDNLWRFTSEGADAAVFSGGKDLAGPQASGLIVGKQHLMHKIQEIGYPNYGIGRILKVGREEMVGLYSALEQYLAMDPRARRRQCDRQVDLLEEGLKGSSLFRSERRPVNDSGQPLPRSFVRILQQELLTPERLMRELLAGQPKIFALSEGEPGVFISPMTMEETEVAPLVRRLREIEKAAISAKVPEA